MGDKKPDTLIMFIIFYMLLIIMMKFLNNFSIISLDFVEFPTFQLSSNIILMFGIFPFIFGLFGFIGNLMLFTTPYWLVNIVLWGLRAITGIELLLWIKSLFHPTTT